MNLKLLRNLLAVAILGELSGCCTTAVLDKARGETCVARDGHIVESVKPQPAAYALVPLAVVGDVAALPYWIGYTVSVWCGLVKDPM